MFKIYDEPKSPNEWACLGYMKYDEPESSKELGMVIKALICPNPKEIPVGQTMNRA